MEEEEIRQKMHDALVPLAREFQRLGMGITLLAFQYNTNGGQNPVIYMSTAKREDMITAMKEFIAHAEGRAIDGGKKVN